MPAAPIPRLSAAERWRLLLGTALSLPVRLLLPKPGLVARMWGRLRGAWDWRWQRGLLSLAAAAQPSNHDHESDMPQALTLHRNLAPDQAFVPQADHVPDRAASAFDAPRWSEPPLGKGTLCIAVLTLNEERHIENCLRSAAFADQVVVVDSGSTDQTCAIAERMGAQIVHRPDWRGFGLTRQSGPVDHYTIADCLGDLDALLTLLAPFMMSLFLA